MTWPKSWTDMELYHWLALAGGVLALLAIVLAVAMRNRPAVRVPASVAAALAAFAAGVGVGVVLLTGFGWHWEKKENPSTSPEAVAGQGGGPVMMQMGTRGGPPGGRGGRGGGRGGRGGAGGPSPKAQLANLVTKLDVLTSKPLAVELPAEKKKQLLEQLRGLGEKDEMSDDEAKTKLDSLLKTLEGDKATLEAAGYNWPGSAPPGRGGRGGRGGAAGPENPFKQGTNREHLDALEKRLK